MIDSKAILKQLHSARASAEKELARLEATIKAFGGSVSSARAAVGKRKISPEGLRNIKLAQRRRWAKHKGRKAAAKNRPAAAPNA